MDRLAHINATVNAITALDFDLRVSIAHRLLMKLEEKKDITRWEFWDREQVREHGSEIADAHLSDEQVDKIMESLNYDWNNPRTSIRSTEVFTDALGKVISGDKEENHS